jgi:hypothetical protein
MHHFLLVGPNLMLMQRIVSALLPPPYPFLTLLLILALSPTCESPSSSPVAIDPPLLLSSPRLPGL